MPSQVKARYSNGKLEPLEPLNLTEGCLVSLSVSEEPEPGGESVLEMFEKLHRDFPPESRELLPTDGAKNYKHYLYGHPKEED